MFGQLPTTAQDILDWDWAQFESYFADLQARDLNAETLDTWLSDWTRIAELVMELASRRHVAMTQNTADKDAETAYYAFLDELLPPVRKANHRLNRKLLDSGLKPDTFAVPLQRIHAEVSLFREANIPLLTEEAKLGSDYQKIVGAQTVEWQGEERTLAQMRTVAQDTDRARRESAWRLVSDRWLQDRDAINDLWKKLMSLRGQIAANADHPDYRAYRWQDFHRFDYTPDDCLRFHAAIEEVVVPAAERIYARRQKRLSVDALRPWDLQVDPLNRPPLKPYPAGESDVLNAKMSAIFHNVAPELGAYYDIMRDEHLLDLDNRKNKAPGGYCTTFNAVKRPFIFMNGVGLHDDVQTLLHEGGHAFHAFDAARLPYFQQRDVPIEFAEVASMAMELLGAPYLTEDSDGFYSEADARRAQVEHLEGIIQFWPYMAVVDAFQHWVYTHHAEASDPANCDAKWAELWGRFMKGVDWSGLEDALLTGWHRKLHIHEIPFYYIEYGLAQLGAVQVWRNSLTDPSKALVDYRSALALGGTRSLPDLFAAAGAQLAFDSALLGKLVELVEGAILELEAV